MFEVITDIKEEFDDEEAIYDDAGDVFDDEDIDGNQQLIDELKSMGKTSRKSKFLIAMTSICSLICVLSQLYLSSVYLPEKRDFNYSNLFAGATVSMETPYTQEILEHFSGLGFGVEDVNYLLLNAIRCNTNLTEEEKDFCYKYIDLFKDNPYLDKERVYHSLLNVDISYKFRPYFYDDSIQGVYVDSLKSIGIFVDDDNNNVLSHELIHCICANDGDLPDFFNEGMTELLANEYFSDSPFLELKNYPLEIYAVKILCDTAGSDAVLKAYTTGDMTCVYESLASYYGTEEDAKKAVAVLNEIFLTINGEIDKPSFSGEELTTGLFNYLNNVIDVKYGDDVEDFDRNCYYYNQILLLNVFSDNLSSINDDLEELGVFCKPYFSTKLKAQYSTPTIGIINDMEVINEKDAQLVKKG